MTVESRPSRTGLWEYVFFIDIDGHQSEPRIQTALKRCTNTPPL